MTQLGRSYVAGHFAAHYASRLDRVIEHRVAEMSSLTSSSSGNIYFSISSSQLNIQFSIPMLSSILAHSHHPANQTAGVTPRTLLPPRIKVNMLFSSHTKICVNCIGPRDKVLIRDYAILGLADDTISYLKPKRSCWRAPAVSLFLFSVKRSNILRGCWVRVISCKH